MKGVGGACGAGRFYMSIVLTTSRLVAQGTTHFFSTTVSSYLYMLVNIILTYTNDEVIITFLRGRVL
jgi:hypothetical protein